ncbi:hypothetical protein SADUNF_Sadunf16G0261600 [Salix dunnii]|uniref:RNase H type-1 domain-containing protein n=1 Tax=Salix dunnii TaxID=1413687 RepID=A0A835MK33_9ROSI|nr:hypothetical protein SADUNF_Sadunf16G0261600 [Salix dunnii]
MEDETVYTLKWNVDGSCRSKPGLAVGIKDSNEAELLAIIKALDLSSTRVEFFGRKFIVEPDYAFVTMEIPLSFYSKERFINNKRVFFYKKTLFCCVGVSSLNLVLSLVNYFYWYTNGWSDDKLVTLLDFVLTVLSWTALSVYLHTQFVNSGQTKFPFLLRSLFSLLFFLSYVGLSRNKCQDTLFEQPLLNGDSSSINGKYRGGDSVTPYANAGLFSILTLSWMGSLIAFGKIKTLDLEDVPQLHSVDSVDGAFPVFKNKLESDSGASSRVTAFKLVKALSLSAWKDILLTALLAIIYTSASYRHWFLRSQQVGIRLCAVAATMIYNKGLTLSCQSKQGQTSGEIINIMTLMKRELVILVVTCMIRVSTSVATIAVMLLNSPLGTLQEHFQDKLMELKDKIINATTEILRNMRILKLQG